MKSRYNNELRVPSSTELWAGHMRKDHNKRTQGAAVNIVIKIIYKKELMASKSEPVLPAAVVGAD